MSLTCATGLRLRGSANITAPVAAFACMYAACLSKPHPPPPLPSSLSSSAKLCRAHCKLATIPGSTAGSIEGLSTRAGAAVAAAATGQPGLPAATPASADYPATAGPGAHAWSTAGVLWLPWRSLQAGLRCVMWHGTERSILLISEVQYMVHLHLVTQVM